MTLTPRVSTIPLALTLETLGAKGEAGWHRAGRRRRDRLPAFSAPFLVTALGCHGVLATR